MQAQVQEKLRVIAGQLDQAIGTFDGILESEDIAALYRASRGAMDALRALHDLDAALLTPEGKQRIQGQIDQERKKRGGRDNFTTGF